MGDPTRFVPLRTDPPPDLAPTLWIRSALTAVIVITAVAVVVADLAGVERGLVAPPAVVVAHVVMVGLLLLWSGRAMANVDAIMPPSRYRRDARAATVGLLWLVGFVVPATAVALIGRTGSGFARTDAVAPTMATIAAVLVALLAAWSPFRYHALHAARIGAPPEAITRWFWLPVSTFVGGLVVLAFASRERFGGDQPLDGAIGVGGVYGLSVGVFAWSTWRAVIVFDEVIDLRWQRWRVEWEQTLADMVAQPAPPPDR